MVHDEIQNDHVLSVDSEKWRDQKLIIEVLKELFNACEMVHVLRRLQVKLHPR